MLSSMFVTFFRKRTCCDGFKIINCLLKLLESVFEVRAGFSRIYRCVKLPGAGLHGFEYVLDKV